MSAGNGYSSQCTLGTKMGHNNTLITPNNKSQSTVQYDYCS